MSYIYRHQAQHSLIIPAIHPTYSEQLYFTDKNYLILATGADTNCVNVVTLLGSSYRARAFVANSLIDSPIFISSEGCEFDLDFRGNCLPWASNVSGVEIYYDKSHSILYVNVVCFFEDQRFLMLSQMLEEASRGDACDDPLWHGYLKNSNMRLIFYSFLVSHVVLFVEERPYVDMEFLDILGRLSEWKQDILNNPPIEFSGLNIAPSARPLLVFAFDISFLSDTGAVESHECEVRHGKPVDGHNRRQFGGNGESRVFSEFQRKLEQQIRILIKKNRNSLNCLFQLDPVQIVHLIGIHSGGVDALLEMALRPREDLDVALQENCSENFSSGLIELRKWIFSKLKLLNGENALKNMRSGSVGFLHDTEGDGSRTSYGVKDDFLVDSTPNTIDFDKKSACKQFNELPTAIYWIEFSQAVLSWIHSSCPSRIDPDYNYSKIKSQEATSISHWVYFTDLPNLYNIGHHVHRQDVMLRVFDGLALGPATFLTENSLKNETYNYWISGHQLCDSISLNNHPCIYPLHISSKGSQSSQKHDSRYTSHCSGFKVLSTCNCGFTQLERDDPFELTVANSDFYFKHTCCKKYKSILLEHLERKTITECNPLEQNDDDKLFLKLLATPHEAGWEVLLLGAREDFVISREILDCNQQVDSNRTNSNFPLQCHHNYEFIEQPGFLDGYRKLISWPLQRTAEPLVEDVVLVGFEYECSNGHRWLLNEESIEKANLDHLLRMNILQMMNSVDFPIFVPCVCSNDTARLMRIYVGTADAPLCFGPRIRVMDQANANVVFLGLGVGGVMNIPRESFVCIRLPYVYSLRGKPLLQKEPLKKNSANCRFFLQARPFFLI